MAPFTSPFKEHFQTIALPPDSYRDELWHLLFGLQIYISNPSNQNFDQKISVWSRDVVHL
jgi:hypothetical protein